MNTNYQVRTEPMYVTGHRILHRYLRRYKLSIVSVKDRIELYKHIRKLDTTPFCFRHAKVTWCLEHAPHMVFYCDEEYANFYFQGECYEIFAPEKFKVIKSIIRRIEKLEHIQKSIDRSKQCQQLIRQAS